MKAKNLIIVLLFFVSCSQSKLKNNLQKEYERLAEKTGQQITVNQINLLKVESLDFEVLANFEIQKLEKVNELRKSEIQMIEEIDSLINVKVNHQKCLFIPVPYLKWSLIFRIAPTALAGEGF